MKTLVILSSLGFLGILSEILNFKKIIHKIAIVGLLVALGITVTEWDNPIPMYFYNMVSFDKNSLKDEVQKRMNGVDIIFDPNAHSNDLGITVMKDGKPFCFVKK